MAESIDECVAYREVVHASNNAALERPGPQLLIVEAVRRFPDNTVVEVGSKRFTLPLQAVEYVIAGSRVILDQTQDLSRVIEPLDDDNQPICRIPVAH